MNEIIDKFDNNNNIQYLESANSQWSKSALHKKNNNKILNLQNYKTTLSSYKNIFILECLPKLKENVDVDF